MSYAVIMHKPTGEIRLCAASRKVKKTERLIGKRHDFISAASLGLLAKYKHDQKRRRKS